MPGLTYQTSQQNFNTPELNATTGETTGSGGSIWDSVLSSLPGILTGTAAIVAASKTGQQNQYGGYYPTQPEQPQNNLLLWAGAAILVIAALYFFVKK